MNIFSEMNCYGQCLRSVAPVVAILIAISVALIAVSIMAGNPKKRLKIFIFSQAAGLAAVITAFYRMNCSEMLTLYLYSGYIIFSTVLIFGMLRYYDRLLIKCLDAKPARSILKWTQDFIDMLTSARVYYFDSAIPRAFASGQSIFLSIGLLELLNDEELKAVLAHEAWHIRHNSRIPFLRQLAMMTFSSSSESELENQADRFAAEIAGEIALASARNKVDKIYN